MKIHPFFLAILLYQDGYSQTPSGSAVNVSIDAAVTLSKHADQVGIWVNTYEDIDNTAFKNAFLDLNLKMIRYGWQGGAFDKNDVNKLEQSPCDNANHGYMSGNCHINERFGPQRVSALSSDLNVYGIGIATIDGINYTGTSDTYIKNLTRQQRMDLYTQRLVDWVNWNKSNGSQYKYFEVGNECDISTSLSNGGVAIEWTGANYGRIARQMAVAAKNADASVGLGINGGLLDDTGTNAWFDSIYKAAPDLNQYISFVVAHKYESWLDYATWRDHADWAFGKCSQGFLASRQEHFPAKPVFVTELGSWKEAPDKFAHYRACLNTEMYGNVFTDSAIASVQQWPTRWGDGVFYDNDNYTFTSMGLGMKAYTKFCHPNLVANNNSNGIRYFAAVNPVTKAMTVWLVNHEESAQTINCSISNFSANRKNARWKLSSPNNDPNSTQTSLWQDGTVATSGSGSDCVFSTLVPPVSVTIIVFESANPTTETFAGIGEKADLSVYPNPAGDHAVIAYRLTRPSEVGVYVYDMLGKEIIQVVNEKQGTGEYKYKLDTRSYKNGVYFIQLRINGQPVKRKLFVSDI